MANIVLNTDFVGKYGLALTQFNTSDIDAYITRYEKHYLIMLLGVDLYNLFQTELATNNPPTTAIYKTIYDPLSFDNNSSIYVSNGMKEMLLGFIYYNYIIDKQQNQTPIGTVKAKTENSNKLNLTSVTTERFNESVAFYNTIQKHICLNSSDYPEYNGQELLNEYAI